MYSQIGTPPPSSVVATPATRATAPADGWFLALRGPLPIEVGAAVGVVLWEPSTFFSGCTKFLTSLEWKTSVPGVVGIGPGDRAHQAILTGRAPGQTHIVAEFTLVGGHARTATLAEAVIVVPATSD